MTALLGVTACSSSVPSSTRAVRSADTSAPTLGDVTFYGGESNLGVEVIDASPDEGGNLWAVASDALYILRAGDTTFRRYTNNDGLHIFSAISAVAGGHANEGYVGLVGYEDGSPTDDPQPLKEAGKAEHVKLLPDGTITSTQYAQLHNDNDFHYYETRSARRLLFVHSGANAGHLFIGGNHGVTNVLDDQWGDHIHVDVREPNGSQLLGEWYGLAIDPATQGLWTCGGYACGLQTFNADPHAWVNGAYQVAFTVFLDGHDLSVPFGYREDFVGVAVDTGGVAYFLSRTRGMASWDPSTSYTTIQPRSIAGLGTPRDVVADLDGTLWVADDTQVLRWDPRTGAATPLNLPVADVRRLYLDAAASPRALYVSTGAGLAVYRGL